ncbi:MAG: chemotaxis-specific protein-glutamate methyltransferase CheB [Candidatus Uhrbacteria bacterium]
MISQKKIKVLVVDDSYFMRRLLREILVEDEDIEIVGEAKNGQEAVDLAESLKPDVVTMDFNMPKLNGVEATRQLLHKAGPVPMVVMISAYTKEGAAETLQSLRAGAVDFVTKPSGELSLDIKKVGEEILHKIKIAARAHVQTFKDLPIRKRVRISPLRAPNTVVVIGASTGGPPVIEDILHALPSDLEAAVIVVQHMPKFFTESFAVRLNTISGLPTHEVIAGEELKGGVVYLSPGGLHISFKKSVEDGQKSALFFSLTPEKPHTGLSSIDSVMNAIAESFQGKVIAVELTGMGADGLEGMAVLKELGAYIIAQDPTTAAVDSMPNAIIDAKLANAILPPNKIPFKIIELCR